MEGTCGSHSSLFSSLDIVTDSSRGIRPIILLKESISSKKLHKINNIDEKKEIWKSQPDEEKYYHLQNEEYNPKKLGQIQ